MVDRTRISSRRTAVPWLSPLPHPSWSGANASSELVPPLTASEFWNRLGL